LGILSRRESLARHEILAESYFKKIQIEARVIGEIVNSMIAPAAITYLNEVIENVKGLKELGFDKVTYSSQYNIIERVTLHVNSILEVSEAMRQERKKANLIEDFREKAIAYDENVKSHFDKIRYHINKLEQIVDDKKWPLPKLRELLFVK
jgi:glutamine synthetase